MISSVAASLYIMLTRAVYFIYIGKGSRGDDTVGFVYFYWEACWNAISVPWTVQGTLVAFQLRPIEVMQIP